MIDPLVQSLPKVELHLHLEGSLRPETMFALAARNRVDLGVESAKELVDQYQFRNFDDFLKLFLRGLEVLRTSEDFATATEALAKELAAQNVRYAEVTTTPFNHHRRGIAMAEYVAGLNAGRQAASALGVEIGWICDIPRELEPPETPFTAELITGPGAPEGVVALGLGGPETGFPPTLFTDSFDRIRAYGLASIPHAGETEGPESVWGAVNALEAKRIGHGVRSIEDPRLIEHLAQHQIALEVCLTSNQALAVVPIADSPLPKLLEAGVAVTLNTDDPAYFSTDLNRELTIAMDQFSIGLADLGEMQRTAIEHSLAERVVKDSMLAEMELWAKSLSTL